MSDSREGAQNRADIMANNSAFALFFLRVLCVLRGSGFLIFERLCANRRESGARRDGILVDALHFGRSTTALDDVRAIPRELLHYAQICDAQAGLQFTTEQMIHTARCERLLPGDGTIDLQGLFAALPSDLPISVEVVNLGREAVTSVQDWAAECLAKSRPFTE